MNAFAHEPERRKNPRSTMTHDQFQEFTMESLEEGKKQFTEIKTDVATLTGHVTKLTGHIETLTSALSENTLLTEKTAGLAQKAVELAQKTADDTADLVKISQFGKKVSIWGRLTAAFVAGRVRWMSSLSKLLAPILIVIAIATAMYHGDKITWKTILEVITK